MREKLEQILVKALDEVNAADTKETLEAAREKLKKTTDSPKAA